MKPRFTPRATANLIEIADYIRARNPTAARRARAAIYDSLQSPILFPNVGRKQKVEGVRKLATRKYTYAKLSKITKTIYALPFSHTKFIPAL
jgi:toxin ParE1/3/4